MDRFNALGRGLQIMLVAGVLLFIDTFFNWQSVDTPVGDFGVSAWDDIGGIIMALLTLVLVAWLAARVAGIDIPVPVSATVLAAAFAVLIFLLALIKNLTDDFSSIWAWIGLILAAALLVGAWLQVQQTGGMDALRSEMPSRQSSSMSSTSTTAESPPATEPMAPGAATPPPPSAAPEPPATEEPPARPPASAPPAGERPPEEER